MTSTELVTLPEQVVEESIPKESSAECHDSTSLPNSISSKHIPDVPVNAYLTPGSVPHLVYLFDKAEKTGRKEKLRWYYYSEEYEKKVVALDLKIILAIKWQERRFMMK
ncbi:12178_t:CDS:2 [Funneliformis geosporum]|nr:12178_t:CDS:2 [Funneliformis geosporum]